MRFYVAELSDIITFIVPVSGDRKWHDAHVEFRERSESDKGMSYAVETALYFAKYVLPTLAVASYFLEK